MSAPRLIKVRRDQLEPHPDLANHPTAGACIEILQRSTAPNSDSLAEAAQLTAMFADATATVGILDPIHVCARSDKPGHYWILDGRHRVESSTAAQFQAWEHAEKAAEEVIVSALFDRRQLTHAQLAWFLINKWPKLADTDERKGGRPPVYGFSNNRPETGRFSLHSVSERYGVRREDMAQAAKVYTLAKKKKRLLETSASVACGRSFSGLLSGLGWIAEPGEEDNENRRKRPRVSAGQTTKKFRTFYTGLRSIFDAEGPAAEQALEVTKKDLVTVLRGTGMPACRAERLRELMREALEQAEAEGLRGEDEFDEELD